MALEKEELIYKTSVPPNTTARLYLPASTVNNVREGGKSIEESKGITYLSEENGRLNFDFRKWPIMKK